MATPIQAPLDEPAHSGMHSCPNCGDFPGPNGGHLRIVHVCDSAQRRHQRDAELADTRRERRLAALAEAFTDAIEEDGWCAAIEQLGRVCDGYEADSKDKAGFGWVQADAFHQRSQLLFELANIGVE